MGIGYNPRIVTDGLVLCLDAANPKSYPGSGTTWTDLSDKNNSSTNYNSATFNSAGYFTFNGSNQYFEGEAIGVSTTAITFVSWCRILSQPTQFSQIIGSSSASGAIYVSPNSSTIFGQLSFTTNGNKQSGSTALSLNTWTQVVTTWQSGSPIILYINGSLSKQSANFTDTISIPKFRIARYSAGTYLNCDVANVKVYNRALSAAEIQQNFNALRGRFRI